MTLEIYKAEGYAYYPVPGMDAYDDTYFAKYQGYADTDTGKALTAARIDLVRRYARPGLVVDVGIGCGSFVDAMSPYAYGYDIMPAAVEWLHARKLYVDPYRYAPRVMTCWDSLEHIQSPGKLIRRVRGSVFVSTPIYRDLDNIRASKHFRPDEHFWYWTHDGLINLFESYGFHCVHHNRMEERHGREDIGTYVFRKR